MLFVLAALTPLSAQLVPPAVSVSEPEYVESKGAVRVEMANHSTQTVTAWKVGISVVFADGVERGHAHAVEGYPALAGLTDGEQRLIPPGKTLETWFPLPRAKTTPVIVLKSSLLWAVFADGSTLGDPTAVTEVFAERERDRKAWLVVAAAIDVARRQASPAAGLHEALAALNAREQEDYEHPVKRTMRRNIQLALQHPSGDYEHFVAFWSDFARRYVAEATRHSRRGQAQ
jgi:hypothetical protein